MPVHELSTADELEALITRALVCRGVPNPEARLVAATMIPLLSRQLESTGPPRDDYLLVPKLGWVIKDDDLDLLGTLTTGVLAAVGTGVLVGQMDRESQANAVVGVVAALFRALHQIHRKSTRLDAIDCAILVILRSSPRGLKAHEVRAALRSVSDRLSQQEVDRRLSALQQVRLRDGTTTALASLSGRGRWSAAGL